MSQNGCAQPLSQSMYKSSFLKITFFRTIVRTVIYKFVVVPSCRSFQETIFRMSPNAQLRKVSKASYMRMLCCERHQLRSIKLIPNTPVCALNQIIAHSRKHALHRSCPFISVFVFFMQRASPSCGELGSTMSNASVHCPGVHHSNF